MRDVDLPGGPVPLVRGSAACLSSVTEAPLADLPPLTGDEPLAHALGIWKSWLAGRGSGLVPIADPRAFRWAGWWIAVVDGSQSPLADGPQQQLAVLACGTSPPVVSARSVCSRSPGRGHRGARPRDRRRRGARARDRAMTPVGTSTLPGGAGSSPRRCRAACRTP